MANKPEPIKEAYLQGRKKETPQNWQSVNTHYLDHYIQTPEYFNQNKPYTIEQAFAFKKAYELIYPEFEFRVVKQTVIEEPEKGK